MEINPDTLPDLSKQPKTRRNEQKMQKSDEEMSRQIGKVNDLLESVLHTGCNGNYAITGLLDPCR